MAHCFRTGPGFRRCAWAPPTSASTHTNTRRFMIVPKIAQFLHILMLAKIARPLIGHTSSSLLSWSSTGVLIWNRRSDVFLVLSSHSISNAFSFEAARVNSARIGSFVFCEKQKILVIFEAHNESIISVRFKRRNGKMNKFKKKSLKNAECEK